MLENAQLKTGRSVDVDVLASTLARAVVLTRWGEGDSGGQKR